MPPINAYWYSRETNFGDLLTPCLLDFFGIEAKNSSVHHSDLLLLGSILQDVSADYSGIIAGAGLIRNISKPLVKAKILGLRGYLTKEKMGVNVDVTLGDPGILASALITKRSDKKFILGVVPHYVDKDDERTIKLARKYPQDVLVIDVQQPPENVISQIDGCNFVLSSSLHGLIVADSLSIPNRWLQLSNKVLGDGFKFHDYYSVYDLTPQPFELYDSIRLSDIVSACKNPAGNEVERVKNNVFGMMKELVKLC